jgi:hypothetical protein
MLCGTEYLLNTQEEMQNQVGAVSQWEVLLRFYFGFVGRVVFGMKFWYHTIRFKLNLPLAGQSWQI